MVDSKCTLDTPFHLSELQFPHVEKNDISASSCFQGPVCCEAGGEEVPPCLNDH